MQLPSVFLTPKGFEDCGEHQSRFTLRCFEKPIKCAGLPAATHTKVKFAGPLAGIHFQVNPKAGESRWKHQEVSLQSSANQQTEPTVCRCRV